jgi:hypothetical protein
LRQIDSNSNRARTRVEPIAPEPVTRGIRFAALQQLAADALASHSRVDEECPDAGGVDGRYRVSALLRVKESKI